MKKKKVKNEKKRYNYSVVVDNPEHVRTEVTDKN